MADNGRIAVVGAGPVGTLAAAALAENGRPFTWVVRNPARRNELGELTLQFPDGGRSFSLESAVICESAASIAGVARAVVAVKAQDVDAVVEALSVPEPHNVIAICNGLHSGPQGLGLLYGGGFLNSGVLVTNRENWLTAGGLDTDSSGWAWVAEALDCSFLSCALSDQMRRLMWQKLAVNCVVNPLTALLDCDNGDLLGRLHGPLVGRIMGEVLAVMDQALEDGAAVPTPAEQLLGIKKVLQATRYNSSSMREDLRQGRPTEVSQINGAVAAEGARLGVDCPVNELLVNMISLLSRAQ